MKLIPAFFVILMGLSSQVWASEFNYSQLNLRYVSAELDSGERGDGEEVEFYVDVSRVVLSMHVVLLEYDTASGIVSRDTHMLGLGSYYELGKSMDLFGDISFGAYNSDSTQNKLAERDVIVYRIGTRFAFDSSNEGMLYVARYDYSENQLSPGSAGIVENMLGFRAFLYQRNDKKLGFNVSVELFDSYRFAGVGLNYDF